MLDEHKWQTTAGLICACTLHANAYKGEEEWERYRCPRLDSGLLWLPRFHCPHLTRLDLDYPELSRIWAPIEINGNLANLQHLRVNSLNVHLYVCTTLRLQTLILTAEQSLNLYVRDISALAATLTMVQLSWISCCPRTLEFAALFKTTGEYCEGRWGGFVDEDMEGDEWPPEWTTRVGFPEVSFVDNLADLCACGVCYTCCTRSMRLWRRNASACSRTLSV